MSTVLDRICAETRAATARARAQRPVAELEQAAAAAPPARGFAKRLREALASDRYGLIAEIKKASPSRGLIRQDFDPPALARAYSDGGASCLSILTDKAFFQGDPSHLTAARAAVDLPVLRKDFMLDPWQVLEARAMGADCILLIMAALDDPMAGTLARDAGALGMDVLVEVHDRAEMDRALALPSQLIGINNRDLKTLRTDIQITEALAKHVPADRLLVSESGLGTPADLVRMAEAGARCFLVGTSLMAQPDVAAATRALLAGEPRRIDPAAMRL